MLFKTKICFIVLLVLFSLSNTFSQIETYPISHDTIYRSFYKNTNIILKYKCDVGSRSFRITSFTLDCAPQNPNTLNSFMKCHPNQYNFESTFQVTCNKSLDAVILTTDSTFEKCKAESQENPTTVAVKSKREAANETNILPKSSLPSPPIRTPQSTTTTKLAINVANNDNDKVNGAGKANDNKVTSTTDKTPQEKKYTMTAPMEAVYIISIEYETLGDTWTLDYHYPHGYLIPTEWQLLIFYQLSLSFYVFLFVAWLVLCCMYHKDLLQVHYYIFFVILLGLIEKIIFVTEYEYLNRTGIKNNYGAVVFGELMSACKRTAARILVVVVSVGFGIVIPRLGKTLYYLLAIALVYFPFASIEGIYARKNKEVVKTGWMMVVGIVLIVIDTFICYWIFSALINVMRKLRLRRNALKLSVYRHFTNTLIFTLLAAVLYIVWFVITFQRYDCNKHWRVSWVDLAFWPFLFQLILLLIIILWRPSPSNNRYAYSALVDEVDDDDESHEPMINDAHEGMKNRGKAEFAPSKQDTVEDALKWVEDNIPKTADSVIPKMLDSDEEIENTLFEINKMQ